MSSSPHSCTQWQQQQQQQLPGIHLRFLTPQDIPEVKCLCAACFPIEYPESWYEDITSNPKFYSVAAVYKKQIIGMLVCEVKPRTRCNREDANILGSQFPPVSQVAYILSLGVLQEHRRNGIASFLLEHLIDHLTSSNNNMCKCVYLHVLTTNTAAINFYERRHFSLHAFLPYYYSIQGSPHDGYCYVLYINGGAPPWVFTDYVKHVGKKIAASDPCGLPRRIFASVITLATCMLQKLQGTYGS